MRNVTLDPAGEGEGYSKDAWVGRWGPCVQTLTLFKTQFSDFPIPFKTEFKIFRPFLRHLTQSQSVSAIRSCRDTLLRQKVMK